MTESKGLKWALALLVKTMPKKLNVQNLHQKVLPALYVISISCDHESLMILSGILLAKQLHNLQTHDVPFGWLISHSSDHWQFTTIPSGNSVPLLSTSVIPSVQ